MENTVSSASNSKVITGLLKKIIGTPVGECHNLTKSEVTIGRSRKSEIFISDPNISRSHCTLKYVKGCWSITDLGGVNGTYLDGKKLSSGNPASLKNGTAIYIGPPSEAPVAFMFWENKVEEEEIYKVPRNNSQEANSDITAPSTSSGILHSNNKAIKRKVEFGPDSSASHSSLLQKRIATASRDNEMLPASQTTEYNADKGNISDCSISSLDSLKTRIRKKNSSVKKCGQVSNAKNTDNVLNCGSPILRTVNYNIHAPSTSSRNLANSIPDITEKLTIIKAGKYDKLLDQIFGENTDGSQDTNGGVENSESLLDESKILLDYEMHANELHHNNLNSKFHTEKLQSGEEVPTLTKDLYTTLEKKLIAELKKTKADLQRTLEDKKNLICLVEAQRSSEREKISRDDFSKLLEEDLFCNICTEIYIQATTLGCCHTFCQYCINAWKSKRKSCPICREKIVTETRILVMDNFVDKIVDLLGEDYKKNRQEVIQNRLKEKAAAKKTKKKKRRQARSVRRDIVESPEAIDTTNESIDYRVSSTMQPLGFPLHSVIQLYSEPEESPAFDMLSASYMDYCYNCGRRDHWAINCPFN